jgi:hypothetical protein
MVKKRKIKMDVLQQPQRSKEWPKAKASEATNLPLKEIEVAALDEKGV